MTGSAPAIGRRLTAYSGRPDASRIAVMLLLLVATVAVVAWQQSIRHLEALMAARLFAGGSLTTYVGDNDTVVFLLPGEARGFALQITPECTSAFLIAPFLAIGAALLLRRRFPPGRVLTGVTLAAVIIVLANQLRIATIAGLILSWGLDRGYQLGHLVVGSLISIVFIALGAVVLISVIVSGRESGRHRAVRS